MAFLAPAINPGLQFCVGVKMLGAMNRLKFSFTVSKSPIKVVW